MEREQTTLRLPVDLYTALERISKQSGLTISALLKAAIWMHVLSLSGTRR